MSEAAAERQRMDSELERYASEKRAQLNEFLRGLADGNQRAEWSVGLGSIRVTESRSSSERTDGAEGGKSVYSDRERRRQ